MISAVLQAARARGWRIACAESCTGGMLATLLTETAGSSDVFDCGFVTYSNAAKIALLGVLPETLNAHGAVSEAVALQMAQGALARSGAQLAVAITGIAGPGGSDFKPEGRVCFAMAAEGYAGAETVEFGPRGRAQVRLAARDHALAMILAQLAPPPLSNLP
jgi:nicotinamide-nucleotide amidase